MSRQSDMRRCLEELDVVAARQMWAALSPHLPQPSTDADVLATLHMARTAAESMPLRSRAYSHRWLQDRGLPSRLPDHMKQPAERLYPRVVGSVGIAVKSRHVEVVEGVRGAMEYAVHDCYAMGDEDPAIVKPQMMAARQRELRALFGRKGK